MTFDYVGDEAATPSMKTLRIEVVPYLPGDRIVGELKLDSRFTGRKVARLMLHELVDEILDKIYPPPPREAAEETIINEIRKARANPCPRMKASSSSCEYCRPDGKCGGIVYATYPPQYDDCVFLKKSNA